MHRPIFPGCPKPKHLLSGIGGDYRTSQNGAVVVWEDKRWDIYEVVESLSPCSRGEGRSPLPRLSLH